MKSFITVDQEEGEKKRLNFHDSFDNFFPFSDLFLIKELCLIFPFFRSVLFFSSFCFSLFPLLISILILSVSFFISSHWVCTCLSPFSPSPCYSLLALFHILSCSTELRLCFLLSWRVVGVHEQARWWDQLSISSHKSIDLTTPTHVSLHCISFLSRGPRGKSEAPVRARLCSCEMLKSCPKMWAV